METEARHFSFPIPDAAMTISPDVLTALRITQEIVAQAQEIRNSGLNKLLSASGELGSTAYICLKSGRAPVGPDLENTKLTDCFDVRAYYNARDFTGVFEQFARDLSRTPRELQDDAKVPLQPADIESYHPLLRAFVQGFGKAAVKAGNLVVGITALNLVSENGILNDPTTLSFIIENTGDFESRFSAAQIIQALVQK